MFLCSVRIVCRFILSIYNVSYKIDDTSLHVYKGQQASVVHMQVS